MSDLQKVFDRLKTFNLRANREKCCFFKDKIMFLGHIIDCDGIHANIEKITAISERRVPRSVKELKSVLQTCSWYRKFVPQFSDISQPLSELTKEK